MKVRSNPKLAEICEKIHKLSWKNDEGLRVISFDQVRDMLSQELGGLDEFEVYALSVKNRRRQNLPRPGAVQTGKPVRTMPKLKQH